MQKHRLYAAIVSGHFAVDMFNGVVGVILAVLAVPLVLSDSQIGLTVTLYSLLGALTQPFFGWLADKMPDETRGLRLTPLMLTGLAVLWMALAYVGVALLATTWISLLAFLLMASLGSGLFHPIGTAKSVTAYTGSANTGTALFFLIGQMGFAVGPILAGFLLAGVGVGGILALVVAGTLPGLLLFVTMNDPQPSAFRAARSEVTPKRSEILRSLMSFSILAFAIIVTLRSSIHGIYQFLLPSMFAQRGWDPALYGLVAGIVVGAAAAGNLIVGKLTDRFGMRAVVFASLLLSAPLGVLFLSSNSIPIVIVSAVFTGIMVGGPHSVMVVHGQRLLPVGKSLASGLMLGFTFGSGALGMWLAGIFGDIYSLQTALIGIALTGIPAAFLALSLPGKDITATADELPVVAQAAQEQHSPAA
ncbi:MAG: MFS transporter [Chloroflexaceae bacterium]|nr:MFS transporter [Chloroflexaceae bacterium]